jgi:uncharacterized DUF497 family protein
MFEYDPAKSAANKAKHGINFEEAQALWLDDDLLISRSRPNASEERWLAIGIIGQRRWTAIFTMRGVNIRLISVRRAREQEVAAYEREDD